jgi:SpoVK/Ycf46/Vps4 family AAA+-type ATPase
MFEEYKELVHLSRLALSGRRQDVQTFISRLARRLQTVRPDVSEQLQRLLMESPTSASPLRNEAISAIPTDSDSRLRLARPEFPVMLDAQPIWTDEVRQKIRQVLAERSRQPELAKEGLLPTRSVLLTGKPGVGKSLTARWIANQLERPLVTLDLSAVMSSFLGKTGTNVRYVLDYAKNMECVLFLDELDAVAKRRDDETEIGELKRLVTVLLQEIDDWPSTGLLIAATNHPDLLDPAIWRRFELIIQLPMPSDDQTRLAVQKEIGGRINNPELIEIIYLSLRGLSFSDISRELRRIIRQSVLSGNPIKNAIEDMIRERLTQMPLRDKKLIATRMMDAGFSQNETHMWTRLHRDTLRRMR